MIEFAPQDRTLDPSPGARPRRSLQLRSWLRDLVISLALSAFVIIFLYQPVKVEGTSMLPGLEDQERIFDRFHRADTRLSRATAGVGLGLYITRNIIEGHGGRLWVDSAGPNRGSTLSIILPSGPDS